MWELGKMTALGKEVLKKYLQRWVVSKDLKWT